MDIEVGPARRPGVSSEIYRQPLKGADLDTDRDGSLTLTIDASGINCMKSLYRYKITFSADEIQMLLRATELSDPYPEAETHGRNVMWLVTQA